MQIPVDDILINYEVFGKSKNDALIILHGWGRNLKEWREIAKAVSSKHQVILVDLPGFGNSTRPQKTIDTYDYAVYISKLFVKLKVTSCIMLGHSIGGKIGVVLASQNKYVSKLILVASSGVPRKLYQTIYFLLINILSKFLPKQVKSKISGLLQSNDYKTAGKMKDVLRKIVGQHVLPEARKIVIQTLIIWGDKDNTLPLTDAKILNRTIKHSSVRVVWGTGHDPHLESPEQFLRIINGFI